LHFLDWNVV